MQSKPSFPLIIAMLAALAAIALTAYAAWRMSRPALEGAVGPNAVVGASRVVKVSPEIKIGGPFTLTDHTGKRVHDTDFRGRLMLVYFGYGYCPDVCPTELQNIAAALDMLGTDAKTVQPIFITVDPERDTVKFLAEYVPQFYPRLIGLTGTPAEIDAVAKEYRVYHARAKDDVPPAKGGTGKDAESQDYLVDHSAFVYLMGRDGTYLTMFRPATDPRKIAQTLTAYLTDEQAARK